MKITRLYTGDDGQSHFEDIEIPLQDHGDIGQLSEIYGVKGVIFRENPGDYHYQWHNAPCRQYIVMLEGSLDVEIGDGSRRIFKPGEILLAEDTTGQGHFSRAVNRQPRKSLFIPLNPETCTGVYLSQAEEGELVLRSPEKQSN